MASNVKLRRCIDCSRVGFVVEYTQEPVIAGLFPNISRTYALTLIDINLALRAPQRRHTRTKIQNALFTRSSAVDMALSVSSSARFSPLTISALVRHTFSALLSRTTFSPCMAYPTRCPLVFADVQVSRGVAPRRVVPRHTKD